MVNRPGRPPERCSKLGVCGVGVGAGHACRSRDSLRLLTPSDGRGKRHPSTCTEDEDDAPASSRVEDEEAPPSPSVASSDGGLNQFAKMRLIERGRATAFSTSGARQRGAPCWRYMSALPSPENQRTPAKPQNDSEARRPKRFRPGGQRSTMGAWPVPSRRDARCGSGERALRSAARWITHHSLQSSSGLFRPHHQLCTHTVVGYRRVRVCTCACGH